MVLVLLAVEKKLLFLRACESETGENFFLSLLRVESKVGRKEAHGNLVITNRSEKFLIAGSVALITRKS